MSLHQKNFLLTVPTGNNNPFARGDYFRRLNLICAKCGLTLCGSYITACSEYLGLPLSSFLTRRSDKIEHFTYFLCPTLFGPQDSYYEHDGDLYCHFHYSTRFATKCAGCSSAILKQFVEINRNMRDKCWHPECYMINKVRSHMLSCTLAMFIYWHSSGMSKSSRRGQAGPSLMVRSLSSRRSRKKNERYQLL